MDWVHISRSSVSRFPLFLSFFFFFFSPLLLDCRKPHLQTRPRQEPPMSTDAVPSTESLLLAGSPYSKLSLWKRKRSFSSIRPDQSKFDQAPYTTVAAANATLHHTTSTSTLRSHTRGLSTTLLKRCSSTGDFNNHPRQPHAPATQFGPESNAPTLTDQFAISQPLINAHSSDTIIVDKFTPLQVSVSPSFSTSSTLFQSNTFSLFSDPLPDEPSPCPSPSASFSSLVDAYLSSDDDIHDDIDNDNARSEVIESTEPLPLQENNTSYVPASPSSVMAATIDYTLSKRPPAVGRESSPFSDNDVFYDTAEPRTSFPDLPSRSSCRPTAAALLPCRSVSAGSDTSLLAPNIAWIGVSSDPLLSPSSPSLSYGTQVRALSTQLALSRRASCPNPYAARRAMMLDRKGLGINPTIADTSTGTGTGTGTGNGSDNPSWSASSPAQRSNRTSQSRPLLPNTVQIAPKSGNGPNGPKRTNIGKSEQKSTTTTEPLSLPISCPSPTSAILSPATTTTNTSKPLAPSATDTPATAAAAATAPFHRHSIAASAALPPQPPLGHHRVKFLADNGAKPAVPEFTNNAFDNQFQDTDFCPYCETVHAVSYCPSNNHSSSDYTPLFNRHLSLDLELSLFRAPKSSSTHNPTAIRHSFQVVNKPLPPLPPNTISSVSLKPLNSAKLELTPPKASRRLSAPLGTISKQDSHRSSSNLKATAASTLTPGSSPALITITPRPKTTDSSSSMKSHRQVSQAASSQNLPGSPASTASTASLNKAAKRPHFFRRLFGGGGSSSTPTPPPSASSTTRPKASTSTIRADAGLKPVPISSTQSNRSQSSAVANSTVSQSNVSNLDFLTTNNSFSSSFPSILIPLSDKRSPLESCQLTLF